MEGPLPEQYGKELLGLTERALVEEPEAWLPRLGLGARRGIGGGRTQLAVQATVGAALFAERELGGGDEGERRVAIVGVRTPRRARDISAAEARASMC